MMINKSTDKWDRISDNNMWDVETGRISEKRLRRSEVNRRQAFDILSQDEQNDKIDEECQLRNP